MADELLVERTDRILRVTLNRPDKLNPLSRSVLARLRTVFDGARGDDTLACVVVTGAGERYFAAGGDLRDLAQVREEADVRAMGEEARAALDAVRTFPLPVVAVLNGDAIGGGAELAVACDFRLMAEGTAIGYVHGRLAISAAWGGGADLIGLVGPSRALRMMARGELVPGATALHWGLADAVVARDELDAAVAAFVAPIVGQSPRVLRAAKAAAIAARRGEAFAERRAAELDAFVATWTHPEHWERLGRVMPD